MFLELRAMVSTYFQVDTIALNLGILKVCSVDAYDAAFSTNSVKAVRKSGKGGIQGRNAQECHQTPDLRHQLLGPRLSATGREAAPIFRRQVDSC